MSDRIDATYCSTKETRNNSVMFQTLIYHLCERDAGSWVGRFHVCRPHLGCGNIRYVHACDKRPFLLSFPYLCLSRACLGKTDRFQYKNGAKSAFVFRTVEEHHAQERLVAGERTQHQALTMAD
jgi:hypothetical protein